MLQESKALREKRYALITEARKLIEKEQVTAEDRAAFDKAMADADLIRSDIERLELVHASAKEAEEIIYRSGARQLASEDRGDANSASVKYKRAWLAWARGGDTALSSEERSILKSRGVNDQEARAQTITTTGGGYTIPQDFLVELDKALLYYGGMRDAARILKTPDGRTLPMPSYNDTSNTATLTSINTQTTATDLTFGQVSLSAYTFKSLVLVPIELQQDSAFDLQKYIVDALAERIYRATTSYFTTGTGSGQPQGVITGATSGATAAGKVSIAYNDLVELQHSVDPWYRMKPTSCFMMHDSTLKSLKELKDSYGRPLWLPGLAVNQPDTILGHKYYINNFVDQFGSLNKPVVFGDFSKFMIRDVSDMLVMRLTERFADYGQVGYMVFSRHDSKLLDAGTHPIKYLVCPT